jgi:hypothetical protein
LMHPADLDEERVEIDVHEAGGHVRRYGLGVKL